MGKLSLFVGTITLCIIAGFAGVNFGLPAVEARLNPIDQHVSLRAQTASSAELGSGWGPSSYAGAPLTRQTASLTFRLERRAIGDLALDVLFAQSKASVPKALRMAVDVNGRPVGSVHAAPGKTGRVVVPAALVSKARPVTVALSTNGASDGLYIEALAIRELRALSDLDGYIDACSTTAVTGWARSGTAPSPVVVHRPGAPLATVMPTLIRVDLERAGHPRDAGFRIEFTKPAARGDKIDVVFPNGRHLSGSPCRVK